MLNFLYKSFKLLRTIYNKRNLSNLQNGGKLILGNYNY